MLYALLRLNQVVSWLWSPVIFNPNGVEWLDVIKDFDGWLQWITAEDDDPDKSWKAWWIQQNAVRYPTASFMLRNDDLREVK